MGAERKHQLIVVGRNGLPKDNVTKLHNSMAEASEYGRLNYGTGNFFAKPYHAWIKTRAGKRHKILMALNTRWNKHKATK